MVRPVVIVKQGWLRGVESKSEGRGSFIFFKGIPFAKPPVNDLRFKDPEPPEPWTGVRPALREGPRCMQHDDSSGKVKGDEDCLYLNVATTSLESSRPVMVWIHGGGFLWGDGGSSLYGPDYLVEKDVIVVTINYRLGVFGFLSLEHEVLPGNLGLKDQVAALKWVKENISQFGGDPNNVTIFGESAGGASVHYLLLSPLSKGLFHKAIAQSGVALNPWCSATETADVAQCLAKYLGKDTTDPNEIVKYLRTIPARELCDAAQNMLTPEEKVLRGVIFAPVVDSRSTEPFLPRPVPELVAEGHDVPFMIGYNSHEGNIVLMGSTDEIISGLDQYFDGVISSTIREIPPSKVQDAVDKIRKYYFGDKKVDKDTIEEFIQCVGDLFFVVGIHEAVDNRVQTKSPTYLYQFTYDAPQKMSKILWKHEVKGAGHFDEIVYLFKPSIFPDIPFIEPGSTEHLISKRFIRIWTDFAKTGNPTPNLDDLITTEWKPVTRTAKNYLAIDAELSAGVNPSQKACQFWKRIFTNDLYGPTLQVDDLITEKWKPLAADAKNYLAIGSKLKDGVSLNSVERQAWKRMYAFIKNP